MCTSIFQIADDQTHLFSRTMDWHGLYAFPLFVPRRYKWNSVYDGKEYVNKYAAIGSGHNRKMHADLSDGVNEFGLSVQKLTFANAGRHYAKKRNDQKIQLAPFKFAFWAMTNFRSVQEPVESLPLIEVMNDSESSNEYGDADLHYAAADPSGRFVIIEPLSMPMQVIENPLGVVTNAPNFKREVNKLNDYMPLLPEYVSGQLAYDSQHAASKDFSGKKQLPGGYTPSARFIRAAYLKERIDPAADQKEQLVNAWHILNSVTVPKMSTRSDTCTVYRSAVALETRTLYYESYSGTGLFKLVLNDNLLEQSKEIFYKENISDFQTISLN
ncbi:choloylglycine hydrolase family protein [Oenococcus sp. UCMA 16435]|nr:choloylglycine hydrolase family protein [Oenococcus sp. UCMA 16435]